MLPESEHEPTVVRQQTVRIGVTPAVPGDLLIPEGSVRLREGRMLRAAVPEAAVDEDGYVCTREQDVTAPSSVHRNQCVNPIAKSTPFKDAPDGDYESRVPPAFRSHRR